MFFRLTQLNASHNAWHARCGHCLNQTRTWVGSTHGLGLKNQRLDCAVMTKMASSLDSCVSDVRQCCVGSASFSRVLAWVAKVMGWVGFYKLDPCLCLV